MHNIYLSGLVVINFILYQLNSYSIDSYTLQVTGEETYIYGKVELVAFRDIRR